MSADLIRPILIENPNTFAAIGFEYGDPKEKEVRCYRTEFPNGSTLPCLTYSDTVGSKGSPIKRYLQFQVTVWGSDELECKHVANLVECALDGYSGTVDGIEIDGIEMTTYRDNLIEAHTHLWYSIRSFEMLYGST